MLLEILKLFGLIAIGAFALASAITLFMVLYYDYRE